MTDVHQLFAFENDGRTFTCQVDALRRSCTEAWWWFRVSSDDRQRYAPFRAVASDTRDDVRARIVAYYDDLLARRAEPAHSPWRRRPFTPATPATSAGSAAPAPPSAPGTPDASGGPAA